jgi:eukaryotic-like serine/threonine-protein kinase
MPLRGEARRPTYRIDKRLSGGSAADDVYLAWHNVFKGPCVQKRVLIHGLEDALASHEPGFLNELDHPHIVEVREAQFDPDQDGAITFVMRYYEGGSIERALLEDYRFSIYQAVDLTVQVLDALAYVLREKGAIHRDVKPGNVVLDGDRVNAFVSDFGSAATLGDDGAAAAVLGTDHYRPPEAKCSGRVGPEADLFGVGMTLFEMLNGRLPWENHKFESIEARLRAGRRALPNMALSTYAPHIPDRLRRVVNKAIARDAGKRYSSPEEFIRDLERAKVRSIDWKHDSGDGLQGTWFGAWPPKRSKERRTTYRVTGRILGGGRERGRLLLESDYRRAGTTSWRQVVPDARVSADDVRAVASYFATVEARAIQREPDR